MIRPRGRLTLWFALIVVPFATVTGLVPSLIMPALVAVALFGALALLDAFLAKRLLLGLEATLPEVVRLTKDRDGTIPVGLHLEGGLPKRAVRVGIPFPDTVTAPANGLLVRLPAPEASARFELQCCSHQRGRYVVDALLTEAVSPLGFWARRRTLPVSCELRTYPNLLPERRQLAALFLNRGGLGIHARRQVGQGREFERLREYTRGDSFEDIHWRATAKRRHPITKEYQIERTQEVYVIVDASRMSRRDVPMADPRDTRNPRQENVLETYLRAALVMGLVAERQGDLFGLAAFSDRLHGFVRARNGKAHFDACRDTLYTLNAAPVNPDFGELCAFLRTRLRRRALLIFLTSLDDPQLAESFEHNMELLGNQHMVIAAMFKPHGAQPLFSEKIQSPDQIHDALAGHLRWEDLRQLRLRLRRRGVVFSLLSSENMCTELVTQYINVKQRQLL